MAVEFMDPNPLETGTSVYRQTVSVQVQSTLISRRLNPSVPRLDEAGIPRLVPFGALPRYQDMIYPEACKMLRKPMVIGRPYDTCYLHCLPIQQSSEHHTLIYHEASIAMYHSLGYRSLFLGEFGPFSVDILRRHPQELLCCYSKPYDVNLEYPCHIKRVNWHRPLASVVFLTGSEKPTMALHRRRAFLEFIEILGTSE
ncbi:hypothetical protein ETB97_000211 [Aspergillus alliaceus]|uniref:Uncharacterized protein n=1 Tax=Petromyces alliaceus TaxID=209559 RepID=A0A8H6AFA7_PETAA|nr:hypothetical protein ETB97_000211 [Aspergillus burnettii]